MPLHKRLSIRLLIDVFQRLSVCNLDLVAAGVAFYAMLAIFPAVAAVVAIWGFWADPVIVDEQLEMLRPFVPQDGFDLLDAQVTALIEANSSTLGWATALSLGAALWSTRAGVGALVRGLDTIYGARPRSGFWHSLAAILLTLVLVGLALAALVAVIVLPVVILFFPVGAWTTWLLVAGRWALLFSVGLSGLWLVYRFGPNIPDARARWSSPGAILALSLWILASWGLSTYLTNFGNFNQIYGSIGAVVVLLLWLFLSAYAILMGAALNAELEARK